MCRLTAYAGEPLTADALVFGGTHSLLEQSYVPRELLHGHVNADGYGVVLVQRCHAGSDRRGPPALAGWRPPHAPRGCLVIHDPRLGS